MVNVVTAIMNAASNSSTPSALELASRTHKNIFFWYMCWLLIAAIATLFFTWALWKSSNRRQDAAKAEADARVLGLGADLAKAKEAQATAEKSLLELQKLIREPRTVNWKKGNEILAAGQKGTVEIFYADGNQEAFNLAFSIHGLLTSNGWTASIPEWASGSIPSTGITIGLGGGGFALAPKGNPMDGLPEPARTLYKVLFESIEGNPGVKIAADQQLAVGAMEIMIGPKY